MQHFKIRRSSVAMWPWIMEKMEKKMLRLMCLSGQKQKRTAFVSKFKPCLSLFFFKGQAKCSDPLSMTCCPLPHRLHNAHPKHTHYIVRHSEAFHAFLNPNNGSVTRTNTQWMSENVPRNKRWEGRWQLGTRGDGFVTVWDIFVVLPGPTGTPRRNYRKTKFTFSCVNLACLCQLWT